MRVFSLIARWMGVFAAGAALVACGGGADSGASAAPIAARITVSATTAPPLSA